MVLLVDDTNGEVSLHPEHVYVFEGSAQGWLLNRAAPLLPPGEARTESDGLASCGLFRFGR